MLSTRPLIIFVEKLYINARFVDRNVECVDRNVWLLSMFDSLVDLCSSVDYFDRYFSRNACYFDKLRCFRDNECCKHRLNAFGELVAVIRYVASFVHHFHGNIVAFNLDHEQKHEWRAYCDAPVHRTRRCYLDFLQFRPFVSNVMRKRRHMLQFRSANNFLSTKNSNFAIRFDSKELDGLMTNIVGAQCDASIAELAIDGVFGLLPDALPAAYTSKARLGFIVTVCRHIAPVFEFVAACAAIMTLNEKTKND